MPARSKVLCVLLMTYSATASFAQTSFTSLSIPSTIPTSRSGIRNERHLQATSIGFLCTNSAFAHGYRHGYDEGFHVGDLDLQMGREPRMGLGFKESHQAAREYRSSFGSKQLFEKGYQAGLRGGYTDAITGAEHRVRQRMATAAAGLTTEFLTPSRRAHFDDGFAAGYASAQTENAPGQRITAEYVEQYCRKTAVGAYTIDYCSGFSRGYLLGVFNAARATAESANSWPPEGGISNRR